MKRAISTHDRGNNASGRELTSVDNSTMSIKEVAGALNFPDQSFFGRYLRQYAGMSPSRYREASHPNG